MWEKALLYERCEEYPSLLGTGLRKGLREVIQEASEPYWLL